jgi:uncharacterized protein (TIGR02611 family)
MPHEPPEKTDARVTVGLKADSRSRLSTLITTIRAHPTGSVAFRTAIAVLGTLVVGLGLVLVPLPGPGWLIVFAGLSIWAIEFAWARQLLQYGRRALGAWTAWISLQPWPVKVLVGILGLAFVATVVLLTLQLSLGIDVLAKIGSFFYGA